MNLSKEETFKEKLRIFILTVGIHIVIFIYFFQGNDDSFSEMNNESRMRNDGQIYGSGFHNTEERQGLGVVSSEADVISKK